MRARLARSTSFGGRRTLRSYGEVRAHLTTGMVLAGSPSSTARVRTVQRLSFILWLLIDADLQLVADFRIMLQRPSRTCGIAQPFDAKDGERLPPLIDRDRRNLQRGGYLLVVRAARRSQDNAAAKRQPLRCRVSSVRGKDPDPLQR
jgi:hypothetical protein